jgi:hypothetical protein
MPVVSLNEYMSFVRQAEDVEKQPPFRDEDIESAEYFDIEFSEVHQMWKLSLHDVNGDEISTALFFDYDFMRVYMEEEYGVEIEDDDDDDEMEGVDEYSTETDDTWEYQEND